MDNVFNLLSPKIREIIRREGYVRPTPPQEKAIPLILRGDSVLLIAPTGWGKTEAVFFPLFHLILEEKEKSGVNPKKGVQAIYITPLRALNRDLFRRMQRLARSLGINVSIRHGDTSSYERRKQLASPPDILITTPETLQAILPAPKMRPNLESVRFVVVDEIHELASSKRGAQLALALERLSVLTGKEFQRIGLSATIGSPEMIASFLGGVGRHVTLISLNAHKNMNVTVKLITLPKDEAPEKKLESLFNRVKQIAELIGEHKASIVFVNTRETAESLGLGMMLSKKEIDVRVHHGSLSKEVREATEYEFKVGKLKGVISTSSLELGIDVGNVDLVIQYHSPRQVSRLVQRVGRSGHTVYEASKGVILASGIDDLLESMVISEKAVKGELEPVIPYEQPYDVLAHQLVGFVLDMGGISLSNAFEVFRRAWPYRNMSPKILEDVSAFLSELKILSVKDGMLRRTRTTRKYYYENLSTIPDVKTIPVYDIVSGRQIGTLDSSFIPKLEAEEAFVMNGQPWRLVSIEEDRINVEMLKDASARLPSWLGELIPVPFDVAQEVASLREKVAKWLSGDLVTCPLDNYPIDDESKRLILEVISSHIKEEVLPSQNRILIEKIPSSLVIIHACFGNLVNEALGRLIATSLSLRTGVSASLSITPYHIILGSETSINLNELIDIIKNIKEDDVLPLLLFSIKNSSLYLWHFLHVAKRFGVLERKAEYTQSILKKISRLFEGSILEEEVIREILKEKIDAQKVKQVISAINSGKISIYCSVRLYPSPLAKDALEQVSRELVQPKTPTAQIAKMVKDRLLKEQVKLICLWPSCKGWESLRTVETLPERIICPNCGGSFVAVTYPNDQAGLSRAIRLKRQGIPLSSEDDKTLRRGLETAKIVSSYGKKAVICMAAKGVGPRAAIRILNKPCRFEDDFWMAILEEERKYIKTRRFWD
ncbi:MAG: DEAD/DEAH box helicase [Candidatus Jordarchaeales archaeon]